MLAQQRKLRAACGRIMVFFIAHEDRFGTSVASLSLSALNFVQLA